jgi:glycosyltransferase involved in cell wall biosynthesis
MPVEKPAPRVGWVADAAYPPRSGIGNHAYQLIRGLAGLGVPPRLIHRGRRPQLLDTPLPETVLPDWTGWRGLRRLAPALHPDVRRGLDLIHFPTEFDLWYLRPGKAKRVVTIHGCAAAVLPPELHHRQSPALVRRMAGALREVEGIVTVSESSAAEIEAVYGIPRERLEVIPNGVARVFGETAAADPAWYRERFGIRCPYLLSVGLSIPKKNQLTALKAWGRLAQRGFPHLFVQVGEEGPQLPLLRRAAAELGLADRFVTLGFQEENDLARLYAGASSLLFPTFHEGFGIPVVEAMAAGCPLVASDIPALREVIVGAAALFPPLDDKGMAAEAEHLITDDIYRQWRIALGRERAAHFSWERSARELLDFYRRLTFSPAASA